jgi:SET domain-containing protein
MGKGLFADNGTTNDDVVFKSQAVIIEYEGELMNEMQRFQRYGNHTAPYGVTFNADTFYDCGITRCAAGLINHKPHSQANCKFSTNRLNNRVRIKLLPGKQIKNGQQLTVSYNSETGGNRYVMNEPGVQSYTSTRRRHH